MLVNLKCILKFFSIKINGLAYTQTFFCFPDVPSPPTDPLEIRSLGPNAIIVEWGVPETDGGAPLEGYKIAIRDVKKTMWMEVGHVSADVQKLTIKDLQVSTNQVFPVLSRVWVSKYTREFSVSKVSEPLKIGSLRTFACEF